MDEFGCSFAIAGGHVKVILFGFIHETYTASVAGIFINILNVMVVIIILTHN